MFHPAAVRAIALIISLLAMKLLSFPVFLSILIAMTFSHYAMALYFSRFRASQLWSEKRLQLPLVILGVAILASAWTDSPHMIALFGIHHVCNEVSLTERFLGASRSRLHSLIRYTFEIAVYTAMVFSDLLHAGMSLSPNYLFAVLGLAASANLIFSLKGAGRSFQETLRVRKGELFFVATGVVAAAFCVSSGVGGLDFVLYYHFTFWAIAPIRARLEAGPRAVWTYAFATAATIGVVLPFTPAFDHIGELSVETLSRLTRIGGYFHIISSFALSQAHPAFIRRIFNVSVKSEELRIKNAA